MIETKIKHIKSNEMFECNGSYFYIDTKEYFCDWKGEKRPRDKYILRTVAKKRDFDKINKLLHYVKKDDKDWDTNTEKIKLIKYIRNMKLKHSHSLQKANKSSKSKEERKHRLS